MILLAFAQLVALLAMLMVVNRFHTLLKREIARAAAIASGPPPTPPRAAGFDESPTDPAGPPSQPPR